MKHKHKESVTCNVCGKRFERNHGYGSIICPDCYGDKQKSLNRIFTKDTVFLVCKWYNEGDSIKRIARALNRSEENIRLALRKGGAI